MLRLAIIFLVLAVIAGALNLYGAEGALFSGAKILFFVFIVLAVLSFLGGAVRRPPV